MLVVAHKVVSKAEGRVVRLASRAGERALELAARAGQGPARQVQVVLDESAELVRVAHGRDDLRDASRLRVRERGGRRLERGRRRTSWCCSRSTRTLRPGALRGGSPRCAARGRP